MSKEGSRGIFEKIAPVLLVATILLAFGVGVLWQKVQNLEKGQTAGTTTTTTAQQPAAAQPKVALDTIKGLFSKDLVKFGGNDKKVLFVEVADPSCPYCHVAAGKNPELNKSIDQQSGRKQFTLVADGGPYIAPVVEMKKLVDAGKASYIYVYSPGHGNGEMGAKAMYCAYEKGKFWEVHDLLMSSKGYSFLNDEVKNDKTKSGDVATFLKSAIDSAFLKQCLDSGKYDERVTTDTQIATSLGVRGTPGFFVNDTNFAGAYSYKDMQSVVDAALK